MRPEVLENPGNFTDRKAIGEEESKLIDEHREWGGGLFHARYQSYHSGKNFPYGQRQVRVTRVAAEAKGSGDGEWDYQEMPMVEQME